MIEDYEQKKADKKITVDKVDTSTLSIKRNRYNQDTGEKLAEIISRFDKETLFNKKEILEKELVDINAMLEEFK